MSTTALGTPATTLNYGIVNTGTFIASHIHNYINNYTFCGTGLLDIDATLTIRNCIFEKFANASLADGITLYSDYCCFNFAQASLENAGGTVTGSNNLWGTDPLFKGGYYGRHLHGNSPCVNTGSSVSGLASDLDKQPIGDDTSIGALEYAATNGAYTFYVRNASIARSGDGTAYRIAYSEGGPGAWKGLGTIQWGSKASSFGQGDTLYVCGTIRSEELSVNANGTQGNYLKIRGDYKTATIAKLLTSPDDGISIDGRKYIYIASINMYRPTSVGYYINNASYINIKYSRIASPGSHGIHIASQIASINIRNATITSCHDGVYVQPTKTGTITDLDLRYITVTSATRDGFSLLSNSASQSTLKNIHLTNCKVFNASRSGFRMRSIQTASLRDCKASNCGASVFYIYGNLGNEATNVTLDGCRAYDSPKANGFTTDATTASLLFKGCLADGCLNNFYIQDSTKTKLHYCISRNASVNGIEVTGDASLCEVYNCISFNSRHRSGIVIGGGAGANVFGCVVASNTASGIVDVGADRVTHNNNLSFRNTGSNWAGGLSNGANDIEKDPQFIWSGEGNFHLKHTSPAIGMGTPLGINIDYDRYPVTGIPDVGAFDQKTQGWTFETQYRNECNVVTGSRVVTSNEYDNNWTASNSAIQPNHLFRLQYSTAPHYKINSVTGSKSLVLTDKYVNASQRTFKYDITRSFTACRGYANIFQGDMGVADVLREQVVDEIDIDVGRVYTGVASISKTKITNDSDLYNCFSVLASGVLGVTYNENKIAYIGTLTGSWINT